MIIEGLLTALPPREALVLKIRFGFYDGRPHSLKEVGSLLELSTERARQIEAQAIKKLKSPQFLRILRDYLYQ